MAQSPGPRRAAGPSVWLVILAALLPGCGSVHLRQPEAGNRSVVARPVATPFAAPARSQIALEFLRMVTPQVGWAVAVDHNGYPMAVVRTSDGGLVWQDAGPHGIGGQGLRAVFYSARVAWVTWSHPRSQAWPVIFRTTDGGRTWARMGSVPIGAIGASAPDMVTGQLGWVTAGLGFAAGNSGIAIFRTLDSGAHWQRVELTPGQGRPAPGAIPFACDKGDAVFSSATTGWVTGTCAGGRPTFWASHDGGWTWRHQPLPRPSGMGTLVSCQCSLSAPVFTSPADGALWASDMPGPPARAEAAYLTHDGGQTWAPIHLPGGRVPLQTPDMVTGQRGFVTGGRLTSGGHVRDVWLYATTDGGATWAVRSASPLLVQATLDFVTPSVGFATSISYGPLRSSLLASTDGGATWAPVPAQLATGSPASSPNRSQPPICKTSQLKITMPWSGAAAGTVGGRIGFTNLASGPCRLHGWPVLAAVNAAGKSRTAVDKITTMFGPNLKAAPLVILKPHATAEAVFTGGDHSRSGTCPPPYRLLRVTPPGNSEAVTIRAWIPNYDDYMPACTPIWVSEVVPSQDPAQRYRVH